MTACIQPCFFACMFFMLSLIGSEVTVGIATKEITPPIGTPSAGYVARKGAGMQGVHDPLLATALVIHAGKNTIVFCSVDHLGFSTQMVQDIIHQVHKEKGLEDCEVYIGSSHTHSGGGAFLNIPGVGESLAGVYNEQTMKRYVDQTKETILQAARNPISAKIGVGYGHVEGLNVYRSSWPIDVTPMSDVAVIKVTDLADKPLAVLFNYAAHPTVLDSTNLLFSADFVGYARNHLKSLLGNDVKALFFNGAQADVNPTIFNKVDRFDACDRFGRSLATEVAHIWNKTIAQESLNIQTKKDAYTLTPCATPFGPALPIQRYPTEMNVIVFNHVHVFITIPGELSTVYDREFKEIGKKLGFAHVSILGLTNDAHGYIILPDAWRHKTFESRDSFGGEGYGEEVEQRIDSLLNTLASHS